MYFVILNKRNTCTRLKFVWTGFENMRIIKGGNGEVRLPLVSEVALSLFLFFSFFFFLSFFFFFFSLTCDNRTSCYEIVLSFLSLSNSFRRFFLSLWRKKCMRSCHPRIKIKPGNTDIVSVWSKMVCLFRASFILPRCCCCFIRYEGRLKNQRSAYSEQ